MKINKQVRFYVYLKRKLGRNADLLNFYLLQELGTGKYVLPELCKELEVSRSNFNASLIRLKKQGFICYSGHSSNGILLSNIDPNPPLYSDLPASFMNGGTSR